MALGSPTRTITGSLGHFLCPFFCLLVMPQATLLIEQKYFTIGTAEDTCSPIYKVIFAKTHKTGSSTVQNILLRYIHGANMTMVHPVRHTWVLKFEGSFEKPFQANFETVKVCTIFMKDGKKMPGQSKGAMKTRSIRASKRAPT